VSGHADAAAAGGTALAWLTRGVFWAAFACIATGLGIWLSHAADDTAMVILTVGLVGLLGMPLLKLVSILVEAIAARDWVTFGATLTVIAILAALTLRDAVR
jgi:hypothetical protein